MTPALQQSATHQNFVGGALESQGVLKTGLAFLAAQVPSFKVLNKLSILSAL